jgi:hypothetical protein
MSQDVINCPRCARRTPAARGSCIYCGESLPITKIESAPPQRNIDPSERAFNTVLEPFRPRAEAEAGAALAFALKIELAEAESFIAAGKRLPIMRCQTRQEAEMIAALVRTCGLGATVVADEDLRLETELARARKITLAEDLIEVQHAGGAMKVALSGVRVFVIGLLRNVRMDYAESVPGRGKQAGSVVDLSEYSSEEMLLDVYAASLEQSFRIKSDAFDYSGLVSPLSFRADLNFRAALSALRAAAPGAKVDDDFVRVRRLLARAWPERTRSESRGVKRKGMTFRPLAQSSLVSDNRDQFDRYSRLVFISA